MRWRQHLVEHLARGAFLGLAAAAALWSTNVTSVTVFGTFALVPAMAGIVLNLLRHKESRESLRRAPIPRLMLGVFDHPRWVHGSVIAGSVAAAAYLRWPWHSTLGCFAIGLAFGFVVYSLYRIRSPLARRWCSILSLFLAVGTAMYLASKGFVQPSGPAAVTALAVFFASIVYYLLTFAGESEESEFDIAIVCFGLAVSLASLNLPPAARSVVVLFPLALFVVYSERIRKNLVVFKHAIRGLEQERTGRLREALVWYRLALDADPKSELAMAGNWRVHQKIDLADMSFDPDLIEMIDPGVCLERARALSAKAHDEETAKEVQKLLDIVEFRDPGRRYQAGRTRIDVLIAQNRIDDATVAARRLVSEAPTELAILSDRELDALFGTWTALLREPALAAAGAAFLDEPHRLPVFLAVLEEQRKRSPKDELAESFRPFVYRKLRLSDVERLVALGDAESMSRIDWRYVRQVAQELAAESTAREEAIAMLRIAEIGLPGERLSVWRDLARLQEAINPDLASEWYEKIFREGSERGHRTLGESEREAVFESARFLGVRAGERGDTEQAIAAWELYSQSAKAGVETHGRLIDLYENRGDRLSAIRHVHAILAFHLGEKDKRAWLAKRDRLYHEISPSDVQSRSAEAAAFFDASYCLRTATRIFEDKGPSTEVMHYLDLVSAVRVENLLDVNFVLGRLHLREGRDADAAACLQAVAGNKPKRFRDKDQERSYYRACRILGEILVDRLNRPADAIGYLSAFKDHLDSGADTLFLLARAYEASGQIPQAKKWYDMVLVYPSHPKAAAAQEALSRLTAK